jgi:HK97 family phage prohead protease
MKTDREIRLYTGLDMEMRATSDGTTADFRGYACAYDFWYEVAGGPEYGGWMEMVAAGAGTRTLNAKPSVVLLLNHDGIPLARTTSGTMTLEENKKGLLALAPALDLRNPKVQEANSALDRKDVDAMSFAFRVTRQEWNEDYTERIIREYDLNIVGSDVSIVTYPANPATVAQVRSAAHIDELRSNAAAAAPAMSLAHLRAIATQIRVHA